MIRRLTVETLVHKPNNSDYVETRFSCLKLTIYEQIEELRLKMQEIASDKDLTDMRVVGISERLDVLINEFYKIKSNK